MRVYSTYKEMRWSGGEGFPPEGIIFRNYYAEVDDETAARLILNNPEQFSRVQFAVDARIETVYAVPGDAPAVAAPAPAPADGGGN